MQYYIIKDKVTDLAAKQEIPLQEIVDRLDGSYEYREKMVLQGGPTRSLTTINSLCGILHTTRKAFALQKREPWDDTHDGSVIMTHMNDPLDKEMAHFA